MRKVLFAVAGVGLLLVVMAPVVVGDGGSKFKASLNGYLEVPSISSNARGSFRAEVKSDRIKYTLSLRDFAETPMFAHIHFARPDVNGGVAAFLCGGGGKPACPTNGKVTGTIVAADVIGPTGQGIAPGEFAELVRAMRNGATYVNAHTPTYPGGEIRGNIRRD
jgi:hypothetical protein